MIKNGIAKGKYIETNNNTLCDLRRFQDFLCCHLIKLKNYERMGPRSNQPCRFIATIKTSKFEFIEYSYLESIN